MRKTSLETYLIPDAKAEELRRFYASMTTGLHALAQPLTVLRSAVSASAREDLSEADRRWYLDASVDQIEHACNLFHRLQQLLIAGRVKADCAPIELAEMLAPVVEDQRQALEISGIDFKFTSAGILEPVLGDMDRTLQALFAALKIAASLSTRGDVIELPVSSDARCVELMIQNRRHHAKRMNSSDRLNLALAEANLLSQQGGYEYTEDPFRVSFSLPIQHVAATTTEDALYDASSHQLH
jgi:signal transduction histidine kinase